MKKERKKERKKEKKKTGETEREEKATESTKRDVVENATETDNHLQEIEAAEIVMVIKQRD